MAVRVGILGATGYTGVELLRLLRNHPEAEVSYCSSRQYNGQKISEVFEFLQGIVEMPLEEFDVSAIASRCDVVFSCLPHQTSMGFISQLPASVRIIDLSADFRLRDAATYASWYQEHSAPDLLGQAVYGLCEVYRAQIKSARLIANPGCYPTSVLLPLIPLLKAGLVEAKGIIVDAKSGVSGAGRGLSLKTHICEAGENFSAYKVGRSHRHIPEIEQELGLAAGTGLNIDFSAHLIPASRGMLSTIYLNTSRSEAELKACLREFYAGSAFVSVRDNIPAIKDVRATNRCAIGLTVNEVTGRAVIVSVIDNLTKGAAGQALQNMNLMFDLPETRGLDLLPVFP
ncbi:MAG: N-acetyl-gamma-glutamyl-phosphate reductase [Deltaproteobacteria bacterium ADurb.Bin510]|nr:MAG: N-acetyl-gamma-glutamyl-phosphate reductase [Deltaproteobacteria bacterium ADurb.Bin510]